MSQGLGFLNKNEKGRFSAILFNVDCPKPKDYQYFSLLLSRSLTLEFEFQVIVSRRRFYSPRVRSGSARGPFGVRSGSVRAPFGLRSGRFRTKIFGAKNSKFQKFSICAAVAAAAGALWAAGLGTAAREPPLRQRRPHKLKIFEILNFWLRKFWSEIGPNGPRTDPE